MRNFRSIVEKEVRASEIFDLQRVRSLTLRASRPSVESPWSREKPTESSSFLTLEPRLRALRKRGCRTSC